MTRKGGGFPRAVRLLAGGCLRLRLGPAEIGAEIEEVVLDAGQHGLGLALGMEAGEAEGRIGLVDGAIGLDPEIVLGNAAAVAQRGPALVAAPGVDLRQLDHRVSPPRA